MSIATSTVILYQRSKLYPNKNFVVESIANYLVNLTKKTLSNYQYQKVTRMSLSIKIDMGQDKLVDDYDYASIVNSDNSRVYYYFIINRTWKSESTCEFELLLDTLNTYKFNIDYQLTTKCIITREHKDRISKNTIDEEIPPALKVYDELDYAYTSGRDQVDTHRFVIYFNLQEDYTPYTSIPLVIKAFAVYYNGDELPDTEYSVNDMWIDNDADSQQIFAYVDISIDENTYDWGDLQFYLLIEYNYPRKHQRLVDLVSEEIDVVKYKKNEIYIADRSYTSWLLYYKNTNAITPTDYNQVNPVECRLLNASPTSIGYYTLDQEVMTKVPNGHTYYFVINSTRQYLKFRNSMNDEFFGVVKQGEDVQANLQWGIAITNNAGSYTSRAFTLLKVASSYGYNELEKIVGTSSDYGIRVDGAYEEITFYDDASIILKSGNEIGAISAPNSTLNMSTITKVQSAGSVTIDRTDSKMIKIIELPYCPTAFTVQSNYIQLGKEWDFDNVDKTYKLMDEDIRFSTTFDSDVPNPFAELAVAVPETINVSASRDDQYESKLFHSDFKYNKFVYDSFSLVFMNELFDVTKVNNLTDLYFKVTFNTSRNIVSKFSFIIPQYQLKLSLSDFDNVINVSRNNEQVLYTSQYINYLRTGYNYDLKSKERQETAGGIGLGLSALGMVTSIVAGVITQNPVVAVGGSIASGISFANQMVSYVKNVSEAEQSIARKLQESKNQAVSVANADDVDLLNAYCGNKAKLCYYEVSDRVKEALADLFYYCGYKTYEQKRPSLTGRYWFNFVSAKIEFDYNLTGLTREVMDDLSQRWEDGITVFHEHSSTWNLDQDKENWETSLLE